MKKVRLIVPFMTGYGGTEKVISNLIDAYNFKLNRQIELKITSYGGFKNDAWISKADYQLVAMADSDFFRRVQYLILLPWLILNLVRKTDADIIISTNPIMWAITFFWIKKMKKDIRVVAWYHYSLKKKPVRKQLLKMADEYLAISSGVRDELTALGISSNKIHLIFNPIPRSKKIIPRPEKKTEIVYVGRLMMHGQKNLSELFAALKNIKTDNWHLSLYGDGFEGDVKTVKKFVADNNLTNQVKFYGFVEHPWDVMRNATFLALTSTYEGFGMVLAEALAHGVYVVSSDCETGPRDIINGKNGQIYPVGAVRQLTNVIDKIVDNPESLPTHQELVNSVKIFYQDVYYDKFEDAIING